MLQLVRHAWRQMVRQSFCSIVAFNAGYNPDTELLGVSSVAGNQTCAKTTENAVKVLAAAGLGHIGASAEGVSMQRVMPVLTSEDEMSSPSSVIYTYDFDCIRFSDHCLFVVQRSARVRRSR